MLIDIGGGRWLAAEEILMVKPGMRSSVLIRLKNRKKVIVETNVGESVHQAAKRIAEAANEARAKGKDQK